MALAPEGVMFDFDAMTAGNQAGIAECNEPGCSALVRFFVRPSYPTNALSTEAESLLKTIDAFNKFIADLGWTRYAPDENESDLMLHYCPHHPRSHVN